MTFELTMEKPFYAVSLVWNVLRRFLPELITQSIKGMRCFKDNTGAVFDVQAVDAQKFEDIFEHEIQRKNVDFKVKRATALPELKEDLGYQQQSNGGFYENRGSRNMNNHNLPKGPRPEGRFVGGS